jgi:DNA-binding winged helix-turn-helix (wHTH) protein
VLRNMRPSADTERALHLPVTDPPQQASRWRIADLLLDTRRQRVWRAEEEIPLPRLTYALLVALVRRCPDVVADEDLMKAVWPGVIVSPETVSQRVKLLRQALKDDPRSPRYVGRLRGRGYHLVPMAVPLSDEEQGAGHLLGGDTQQQRAAGAKSDTEEWAANPAARDAVIGMLSPGPDDAELFQPDSESTSHSARLSLISRLRTLIGHLRRR